MNKIITCEECGIDYYSETIVPRQSFRHVFPDIVKLEAELADKEKQLAEARAEIERLNKKWADEFTLRGMETSALERTKAKQLKLIEQMREALESALDALENDQFDEYGKPVWNQDEIRQIKVVLAAERGE